MDQIKNIFSTLKQHTLRKNKSDTKFENAHQSGSSRHAKESPSAPNFQTNRYWKYRPILLFIFIVQFISAYKTINYLINH